MLFALYCIVYATVVAHMLVTARKKYSMIYAESFIEYIDTQLI